MKLGWLHAFTVALSISVVISTAGRAEEGLLMHAGNRVCSEGIAKFGRMTCAGVSDGSPVIEAYFSGAASLEEISRNFPVRFAKLKRSCEAKASARQPASVPKGAPAEGEGLRLDVQPLEVCNGKRGYQEPCVRNEDCLENFCHPIRGTCSAVFTVPVPFGN